jgi:hypothetical protein
MSHKSILPTAYTYITVNNCNFNKMCILCHVLTFCTMKQNLISVKVPFQFHVNLKLRVDRYHSINFTVIISNCSYLEDKTGWWMSRYRPCSSHLLPSGAFSTKWHSFFLNTQFVDSSNMSPLCLNPHVTTVMNVGFHWSGTSSSSWPTTGFSRTTQHCAPRRQSALPRIERCPP